MEKKKRRKSKAIGEASLQKLINSTITFRERIIISLLINTGLRKIDIIKLKISDFNFVDGTITIARQQKTKELFYLPLPNDLLNDLKIYIHDFLDEKETWLFPSSWESKEHISERGFNYIIERVVERAEIGDVTPHDFRATFLTQAGKVGIPPKMICDALGMKYSTIMKYYQKYTLEDQKAAFAKLYKKN